MELISIMPGVQVYQDGKNSVLFGSPPEIIKFLMIRKIDFPETIVLPDTCFNKGILQNCTEFPLYYYLFVLGNYFKGGKLTIVGEKNPLEANRELLKLTLLGPEKKDYAAIGKSQYFEGLYRESRHLSVKDKAGQEVPIEGFVNFIPFRNGIADTAHFQIKHKDDNVFEINGTTIDINFTEKQTPPYEVKSEFVPMMPHKFGVDILGGGSGFTPLKPSSGALLNYNSDFMLIDCLPYLDYHLEARGLSREQIKSIYLTHVHDDHCNIFPLVEFNSRIKFIGTKEIYWMAMKKLSLQTLHPVDEFYHTFDFIEVEPYAENDFYGIGIRPHYTVHSIPTIGATFSIKDRGKKHSIVYGGDNKALPEIKKMVDEGIVSKEKFDFIMKIYREHNDILLADGGMGILHGDPEDSIDSASDKVVFLHLEKLPEKFNATFSMAVAGKRYILLESVNSAYLVKTMEFFYEAFSGVSQEWITALMNNISILQLNAGDVILKQGDARKGSIYIILSGSCSVVYHDGQKLKTIARKETGDFIGEMAIIRNEQQRSASVVAGTPVILAEIDEQVFLQFLTAEKRIEPMIKMWEMRKEIEKVFPFSSFSDLVNDRIARKSVRKKVNKGDIIINQGEKNRDFYIVLSGTCHVKKNGKVVGVLTGGGFFGEIGALENRERNATVEAETDGVLLKLSSKDIGAIVNQTPVLNFIISQMIKERKD